MDPFPFKDPALLSAFEKVRYLPHKFFLSNIKQSIIFSKLRKIIRAIRASPQCRQQWFDEISMSRRDAAGFLTEILKMLILDVWTCWSSTHQMCSKSLDYCKEIDSYVAKQKDLRQYELSSEEWDAIILVTDWLRAFRDATTEMSATKHSTLSSTHTIFKGLQDHLAKQLAMLPDTAPKEVCDGLLDLHRKLSNYFYKIDQSPYPV
ncbi:hypothetical protein M422DRAFT_181341 [Sphaerobolus stellatus SS14]|uniref:Unplaced genomic scaffold SPHSTscaffold_118, whole genome shotgun sequence n=1 Tax=Sphaerobolus stellatus (strain SS14) TaxID=990650 RepID=A0A0C9UJL6_SPHS4|nr:hypothetical protein M422DRAFT_181341 [Sphaerobolus stellatus SS14]